MRPQGEHQKIIEHLRRVCNIEWDEETFQKSVDTATVEMLQWMKRNGCPDTEPFLTLSCAAECNRRDVFEWLLRDHADQYHLSAYFARTAVHNGHLALLQWLRTQGCPWDCQVVNAAATAKNLHIFRWMAANGAPIYHSQVDLWDLRQDLLESPAGPLIDAIVPSAMWVHTLIRWRKVKQAVLRWRVARYWARRVCPHWF